MQEDQQGISRFAVKRGQESFIALSLGFFYSYVMPRTARFIAGGVIYHVLNRANNRSPLFEDGADYDAFIRILRQAQEKHPIPMLAYCIMPNHWHMVLRPGPRQGRTLSQYLHWLTVTHAQRLHAFRGTSGLGHIYQARFKAFPVQSGESFLTVASYVERNPLRAGLVDRAEDWRWSSLGCRMSGSPDEKSLLSDWPVEIQMKHWVRKVNHPQTEMELESIRTCVLRGRPFGDSAWMRRTAYRYNLEYSLRDRGRPKGKH